MNRYYAFAATILLGLSAALYIGWGRAPANMADANPALLRADFRADYVLMVAEAYAADQDVDRAEEALAFLDTEDPRAPVETAIEFGSEAGYSSEDLALLGALADALATLDPALLPTDTP